MRRVPWSGIFALGVIAGVVGTALGQPTERLLTHFHTGDSYLAGSADFRVGYVAGLVDALSYARYASESGRQLRDFDDCITHWTIGEITALVDNHVSRSIESLDQSAALLAHMALDQACED